MKPVSDNHSTLAPRIPTTTYRWQFNHLFTFARAQTLIPYLDELGISDVYASPLLKARGGSLHGYDVTDHSRLNPELGTREQFDTFTDSLREREIGLMMDVVPNHLCIAGSENVWWRDVLESGPGSPFAAFFDIDWQPPKETLVGRVLLPVLGDQVGRVLEEGQIALSYQRGAFTANCQGTTLPIAPRTTLPLLQAALQLVRHQADEQHTLELESIITALTYLPPRTATDPDQVRERQREKEIIRRRLWALTAASKVVRRAIEKVIKEYNGTRGNPRSFDQLEELLHTQAWRLCYWRVAADEINYRRFFDVNELAAIRVEEPKVFAAVHDLIFRLVKEGRVTGLRVDHIDGLADPEQYLRELQRHARKALRASQTKPRSFYVVVEKILGHDEKLRADWATHGTTGYDFLNLLNGIFVAPNQTAYEKLYQRFTGVKSDFEKQAYECKKLILQVAMSSELYVLARRLERISEQHRYSRDFTLNSLQAALAEVIACFPVYRTYLCPHVTDIHDEDRRSIHLAIRRAKRRNPAMSQSIFDFIRALLLQEDPEGISAEQRAERREFVLRWQQLTGPVTAKGIEDTAFYRRYPLASLCEVGGDPSHFGVSLEHFHRRNAERLAQWPHALLATSTHDTKRSEDVRARLNVLSEIPARWYRAIRRWQRLNQSYKTPLDNIAAPSDNEEYLLYQTLLGTWPFESFNEETRQPYLQRIQEYFVKALREAKTNSSWINPNEEYEQAVHQFIAGILNNTEFVNDLTEFQQVTARGGMWNSLAQTLLKITVPGVPDFYQGTELWNFALVDPDNRQSVDYEQRQRLLDSLRDDAEPDGKTRAAKLLQHAADGRLKLFLTQRALRFRRAHRAVFEQGSYLPLSAVGARAPHAISFARSIHQQTVIVVATRFLANLPIELAAPIGNEVWHDTTLLLHEELAGCYRDVFTGQQICVQRQGDAYALPLAEACAHLPVALLEKTA